MIGGGGLNLFRAPVLLKLPQKFGDKLRTVVRQNQSWHTTLGYASGCPRRLLPQRALDRSSRSTAGMVDDHQDNREASSCYWQGFEEACGCHFAWPTPHERVARQISSPASGLLPKLIASAQHLRHITRRRAPNVKPKRPASGPRRSLCRTAVRATWGSKISGALSACCGAVLFEHSTASTSAGRQVRSHRLKSQACTADASQVLVHLNALSVEFLEVASGFLNRFWIRLAPPCFTCTG